MKRMLRDSLLPLLCGLMVMLSACNTQTSKKEVSQPVEYTCPMHPSVVKSAPGKCPICGMDLVPVTRSSGSAGTVADSLEHLLKPADEIVVADVKAVHPQKGFRFEEVSLKGRINYNSNNWKSISSRVSGRIERLYVKYNYQPVAKGQKIMEIYSPDLVNAQQEMLYLKRASEPGLLEAAKTKLRLLGVSEGQIRQILSSGKVQTSFAVYSPYSGYVAEIRGQSPQSGAAVAGTGATTIENAGGEGMSGMAAAVASGTPSFPPLAENSPLQVLEGQYVSAGQKVFDLVNSSALWAEFFVAPEQLKLFKRGTEVRVESVDPPVHSANVKVDLIQPYYREGTQFSFVRATLGKRGGWRVGQLIKVRHESAKRTGVWLPRTSVLQLGLRYVAFVSDKGVFRPVYVSVLGRAGNWVDIGNSLDPATPVAENAWFLVDPESFVKPSALEK